MQQIQNDQKYYATKIINYNNIENVCKTHPHPVYIYQINYVYCLRRNINFYIGTRIIVMVIAKEIRCIYLIKTSPNMFFLYII